jgi:hypothetical protein
LSPLRGRGRIAVVVGGLGAAALGLAGVCAAGPGATPDTPGRAKAERLLSGPAADRPLALAFAKQGRLLAVTPHALRLFGLGDAAAQTVAELPLPEPLHPARKAAALLAVDGAASTAWVLTNRAEKACLIAIDGDRLSLRAQADALPWPGSPLGVRYREGTDWIEGSVEGLGAGPFLTLLPGDGALGVSPDGQLVGSGPPSEKGEAPMIVGPTLARLWPGAIAASTAAPPESGDAIVVLDRDHAAWSEARALAVDGAIRAIASWRTPQGAVLVFSTDTSQGYELWRLRLDGPRSR